ncbi:MAG: DUF927 domain-containing protein [Rhodanobacteraceae bacterium]|nr:DUF927 domain-containing protein [Rhodanobacteraceae bacterium]
MPNDRGAGGTRQRHGFATIAAAALAAVDSVLARWLPEGRREGHEYKARNPTRADNKPGSFSINVNTGQWADFASDGGARGGDLIALIAYLEGCKQGEAANKLAEFLGLRSGEAPAAPARAAQAADKGGAAPVCPVPDDAPAAPDAHPRHGKASAVWTYRDRDGLELARVCRFDTGKGKEVLPLTCWRDPGGLRWHWRALPEPRPLYGLDRLGDRPGAFVLVTEGEKDADAAALLLPGFAVVTSSNGARSAGKSDWAPLRGRRVLVWPDADGPGAAYAADVVRLATAAGAQSVAIVKPEAIAEHRPESVRGEPLPEGWGAADALAEGIDREALARVLAHMQASKPAGGARRTREPARAPTGQGAPRSGFVEIKQGDARGLRPGVYWQPVGTVRGSGEMVEGEPQFICAPLKVEALTRDATGNEWGRLLTFADPDGTMHTWAMPAAMTARGGDELREELLRQGLEITPDPNRRRRLVEFILGATPGRFARCVGRTGWDRAAFVLPGRVFGDTGEEAVILQTGASEGAKLSSSGTLDEWRRHVSAPCAGNSRLVLSVSMSFAAPCLALCGAEGGGLNLKGDSTMGKSTALWLGASVYGSPLSDGYVRQWKQTDNALESVAALHSDLLLCLDELGQLEAKSAAGVAYLLGNGCGKARSRRDGSLRAPATWRVLFLSTGEIGLANLMQEAGGRERGGMAVRVVDLPADAGAGLGVFDVVPEGMRPGEFADALRAAASRYHGTAINGFLDALTKNLEQARGFLREYVPSLAADLAGTDAAGQVRRVAQRFALIAAGGRLASEFGLTGWEAWEAPDAVRRCFADWLANRGSKGESEPAAMLAQVRHFLEQNGEARFSGYDRGEDDRAPRTLMRCGWRKKAEGGGQEYLIFPESFRHEVCAGFDAREVARLLVKCGALMPQGDSATRKERMPDGALMRVYRVLPAIWDAVP